MSNLENYRIIREMGPDFRSRYEPTRESLARILNSRVKEGPHTYTDHGIGHSDRILDALNDLIGNDGYPAVPYEKRHSSANRKSDRLSHYELYLLAVAALHHDVEMQYNPAARNTHADGGKKRIQKEFNEAFKSASMYASPLRSSEEQEAVSYIVKAHSDSRKNNGSIEHTLRLRPPKLRSPDGAGEIRTHILAALMRMADEMDCTVNRILNQPIEAMQAQGESKRHFRKCEVVLSLLCSEGPSRGIAIVPNWSVIKREDSASDCALLVEVEQKLRDTLREVNQHVFHALTLSWWKFHDPERIRIEPPGEAAYLIEAVNVVRGALSDGRHVSASRITAPASQTAQPERAPSLVTTALATTPNPILQSKTILLNELEYFQDRRAYLEKVLRDGLFTEEPLYLCGQSLRYALGADETRTLFSLFRRAVVSGRELNLFVAMPSDGNDYPVEQEGGAENYLSYVRATISKVLSLADGLGKDGAKRVHLYLVEEIGLDHILSFGDVSFHRTIVSWDRHKRMRASCYYKTEYPSPVDNIYSALCRRMQEISIEEVDCVKDKIVGKYSGLSAADVFSNARGRIRIYSTFLRSYSALEQDSGMQPSEEDASARPVPVTPGGSNSNGVIGNGPCFSDAARRALDRWVETTENVATHAMTSELKMKGGICRVFRSQDLGFPSNTTRLMGGFTTGSVVSFARNSVPIFPIDCTVNSCCSTVFEIGKEAASMLRGSVSPPGLNRSLTELQRDYGAYTDFFSSNHFINVYRNHVDRDKCYLVLHSSASNYKRGGAQGLYPPSPPVLDLSAPGGCSHQDDEEQPAWCWYKDHIRTCVNRRENRYFRYLIGREARMAYEFSRSSQREIVRYHHLVAEKLLRNISSAGPKWSPVCSRLHYGTHGYDLLFLGTYCIPVSAFCSLPPNKSYMVPVFSARESGIALVDLRSLAREVKVNEALGHMIIEHNGAEYLVLAHGFGQRLKEEKGEIKRIELSERWEGISFAYEDNSVERIGKSDSLGPIVEPRRLDMRSYLRDVFKVGDAIDCAVTYLDFDCEIASKHVKVQ